MDIIKPTELGDAEALNKITVSDLCQIIALIERGVSSLESRFTTRALRNSGPIRSKLNVSVLTEIILTFISSTSSTFTAISKSLPEIKVKSSSSKDIDSKGKECIPEVEVFLTYLVVLFLHDSKSYEQGSVLSIFLVELIQKFNRRTLDQIASRVYFFYSRFLELQGRAYLARPVLLAAQRNATLRHDVDTLATVSNLLLHNYILYNLYDQADKFISKTQFPLSEASNNQVARYMYHLGRIHAIQLKYSSAYQYLLQAIRKAPQTPTSVGFQQTVHKLSIIVEMLMGEIPDRAIFRQPTLRKSLLPYLAITQAVRIGDLAKFQEAISLYEKIFRQDKTYTLIRRLRHTVIKTGIKKISVSYSKISLKDICIKLQLESEEDVEYIISRAIRDGVIDATIDHEEGYVKSKENANVYTTTEPQQAFHQRINFCLDLHNESVKALRFPLKSKNKDLELASKLKDEERKLATGIKDGIEDDDDDEMEF